MKYYVEGRRGTQPWDSDYAGSDPYIDAASEDEALKMLNEMFPDDDECDENRRERYGAFEWRVTPIQDKNPMKTQSKTKLKTKVIFRKWRENGDICAFFPQLAADNQGEYCDSYEHVGQHGGASLETMRADTVPATPAEYADLETELESRGYELVIGYRETPRDIKLRREMARKVNVK